MGVYIPPCGNVLCGINIRVCDIATVWTTKVLSVANADMSALVARLRSICRIDSHERNTIQLAFVFKERTQLEEIPTICLTSESLAVLLVIHSPSDVFQVLNGDALVLGFGLFNKILTDSMVRNGSEASLSSAQPSQQLMAVACAFGLNRRSRSIVFVPNIINLGGMCELTVGLS